MTFNENQLLDLQNEREKEAEENKNEPEKTEGYYDILGVHHENDTRGVADMKEKDFLE